MLELCFQPDLDHDPATSQMFNNTNLKLVCNYSCWCSICYATNEIRELNNIMHGVMHKEGYNMTVVCTQYCYCCVPSAFTLGVNTSIDSI